jgi:hypothetical protein
VVGKLTYHVEPGVSIENKESNAQNEQRTNTSLNILSCLGKRTRYLKLMTSSSGRIIPKVDAKANIAYLLKLRADI